jgi:hypothetical protein
VEPLSNALPGRDGDSIKRTSLLHHGIYRVPHMFCNFYLVKSHKFADNSATAEARVKISTYLESLAF